MKGKKKFIKHTLKKKKRKNRASCHYHHITERISVFKPVNHCCKVKNPIRLISSIQRHRFVPFLNLLIEIVLLPCFFATVERKENHLPYCNFFSPCLPKPDRPVSIALFLFLSAGSIWIPIQFPPHCSITCLAAAGSECDPSAQSRFAGSFVSIELIS